MRSCLRPAWLSSASKLTRRTVLTASTTVGAAIFPGCTSFNSEEDNEGPPPKADQVIHLRDEPMFDPKTVEIRQGDTIVWVNSGSRRGSVTAYEDSVPSFSAYFASGDFGREVTARISYPFLGGLSHGDRYWHTFDVAGQYRYFSIPAESEGMTGTILVHE